MQLPIGISNFKKLIESNAYFVDKSLFIKDIIQDGAEVILLPRPRRFGKTINLSMAHYFFNCATSEDNTHLFKGLAIASHADCMSKQASTPSIFLTFKGIKSTSYEEAYQSIANKIAQLYTAYKPLFNGNALEGKNKKDVEDLCNATAGPVILKNSLKLLTQLLHQKYNKKVMIFLDEYDTPVQAAYLNDYYDEMIDFMSVFLGEGLKDNIYLHKGVITGILRIAQTSIFSDLNNIETYSLLRRDYSQYFGFTQTEVDTLLNDTNLKQHSKDIQTWYNGYQVEDLKLYNPWSIINCVKQEGVLKPYWMNTSDNALIKDLLSKSKLAVKKVFEALLQNESVVQPIQEYIVLPELSKNEEAIWGLLLFSGYLTSEKWEISGRRLNCTLRIPNQEVSFVYEVMIEQWFRDAQSLESYDQLTQSLLNEDWESFKTILQNYIRESGSYFDFNTNTPEAVYHAFILGLVVGLRNHYIIQSNRESGFGRCDVIMIPKDPTQHKGLILEFKRTEDESNLEATAQIALAQICKNDYAALLAQHPVKNIIGLGIVFAGKQVHIKTQKIS